MAGETPPIPRLIAGDLAIDDRGEVGSVNEFHFEGVKRFYIVANHRQGFVRAWHAHRREAKYVLAVHGTAVVGAVQIDDWEHPSKTARVWRFVLSARKPAILYIPPGYANGFMSLTEDAQLIFFSTSPLDESRADDIRFDPRHWDIWMVEER
jgi:dTDP-4-dehydrorhamnose 3,5-epimerase